MCGRVPHGLTIRPHYKAPFSTESLKVGPAGRIKKGGNGRAWTYHIQYWGNQKKMSLPSYTLYASDSFLLLLLQTQLRLRRHKSTEVRLPAKVSSMRSLLRSINPQGMYNMWPYLGKPGISLFFTKITITLYPNSTTIELTLAQIWEVSPSPFQKVLV